MASSGGRRGGIAAQAAWAIGVLAVMAAGVGVIGWVRTTARGARLDATMEYSVGAADPRMFTSTASALEIFPYLAACVVIALAATAFFRPGSRALCCRAVVVILGSLVSAWGLKRALATRLGDSATMPSGHATSALCCGVAVVVFSCVLGYRWLLVVASAVATFGAVGVCVAYWHEPSDAVAAAGIVLMWVLAFLLPGRSTRRGLARASGGDLRRGSKAADGARESEQAENLQPGAEATDPSTAAPTEPASAPGSRAARRAAGGRSESLTRRDRMAGARPSSMSASPSGSRVSRDAGSRRYPKPWALLLGGALIPFVYWVALGLVLMPLGTRKFWLGLIELVTLTVLSLLVLAAATFSSDSPAAGEGARETPGSSPPPSETEAMTRRASRARRQRPGASLH